MIQYNLTTHFAEAEQIECLQYGEIPLYNKRFVRTRLGFGVCGVRLLQRVNPLT
jgi:hypothetical protein